GAGIEDKTPLFKTIIEGPDAEAFVDRVQVRDASKVDVDHGIYTFYCDDEGHAVNEGITFRTASEQFIHMGGPMVGWFSEFADGYDIEIGDTLNTDRDYSVLCVQGPRSHDVMEAVTGSAQKDLPFSRGRMITVNGHEVRLWRTGFTGEIGFEMWVDPVASREMYSIFVEGGRPHGAVPIGNAAQAATRVEAGMLIIGVDYRPSGPFAQVQFAYLDGDRYFHTPAELNFGRLVNFRRDTDFVGRRALEAEAAGDRPGKVMRGVDIDPAGIAALYERAGSPPFLSPRLHRHFNSEILAGGANVGFATSMCWSPVLDTMIGFAHLESPEVHAGDDVTLTWQIYDGRGEAVEGEVPARVVDLPFVEMKRRRITEPARAGR
ncbi:MAG: aminomethyl transferase family protein, partial [Acidimicrobiaceae bacterium]|nr:aminomethyl transferase family protein [Acidimicrobiaceae bacterium]